MCVRFLYAVASAKPRQFDRSCGLKQLLWSIFRNLNWLTRLQCCNACVLEFTSCTGRQCTAEHADFRGHSRDCQCTSWTDQWDHVLAANEIEKMTRCFLSAFESHVWQINFGHAANANSVTDINFLLPLLLFGFC